MTNPSDINPKEEYARRLAARQLQVSFMKRRYRGIGIARIALLIAGAAVFFVAMMRGDSPFLWWLAPIAVATLILLGIHQKTFRAQRKAERAVLYYSRALERLNGNWAGQGTSGERFRETSHPYADDLDLFGEASLFELICAARTRAGENTLAAWLSAPGSVTAVRNRQDAVIELRLRVDLREDLALLGEDLRSGINPQALSTWGEETPEPGLTGLRLITGGLSAATMLTLVVSVVLGNLLPLYAILLLDTVVGLWIRHRINEIIRRLEPACRDLSLLSGVMERIETETFQSPRLLELRLALESNGRPPSAQIAGLNRIIIWLDARLNQLVRPILAPLFWVSQFALAAEAWRVRSGPAVAAWIAAIGEIEALCSLAGYSFEHPDDVFPEFVEEGRLFDGVAMGHPLIPEAKVVRTDLSLGDDLRLLVISGSNMSGKSTLLRTVGMNLLLAMAGAPVRASRLKLSLLQLGASIRIQDNLRAGASLFYAEITRLRQLIEMTADPLPLLFIIDEILHGTNSHDRRLGADAVLRGLLKRGAIGLVTTHDLALTGIVDEVYPIARNVHFADHLENGRMTFDYVLCDGVVTKSNAIELMRSVGLEV